MHETVVCTCGAHLRRTVPLFKMSASGYVWQVDKCFDVSILRKVLQSKAYPDIDQLIADVYNDELALEGWDNLDDREAEEKGIA